MGPQRVISLAPAITETLFALGAAASVTGVSTYCELPAELGPRTRCGTALTPALETIVRLAPTHLLVEETRATPRETLERLAPLTSLPWLSLDDVLASTRRLGALVDRREAAETLARDLERALAPRAGPEAPRALALLLDGAHLEGSLFFVKRNSLHGSALAAAGLRNAIPEDVSGPPVISLEDAIRRNPDVVLLLSARELPPEGEAEMLRPWRDVPIEAVRRGRVLVISHRAILSSGPRMVETVRLLEARLRGAGVAVPPR